MQNLFVQESVYLEQSRLVQYNYYTFYTLHFTFLYILHSTFYILHFFGSEGDEILGIVLASGSPRRYELLKMIGIDDFRVVPDTTDEVIMPFLSPEETVCNIALQKATNVSRSCEADDMIIAADTLVYLDGNPMSKPADADDAANMLRALSGRRHTVFTGIALLRRNDSVTHAEKTEVYFRKLSDSEILAYVKTGEPMDKAGAYAAQGRGAIFVERIEGEFFNVMGLPLCRLAIMLREFGFII